MRTFLAVLAAWLLSATLASAQMMGISGGPFTVGSTYSGPGDIQPGASFFYGVMAYSSAQANTSTKALNARCNSGANAGLTFDVFFTPTGVLNTGTAFNTCQADGAFSATQVTTVQTITTLTSGEVTIGDQISGLGRPLNYVISMGTCVNGAIVPPCTINVFSSETLASPTSLLAAGGVHVTKWYDQTAGNNCGGLSCDIFNATTGSQPLLLNNCLGILPCVAGNSTLVITLTSANNITPSNGNGYLEAVYDRTTASNSAVLRLNNSNNRIFSAGSANTEDIGASTGSIAGTAANGVSHVFSGTINGASSYFNIDGTQTTGTLTAATTAGTIQLLTTAFNGITFEAGWWDNVTPSNTIANSVCHNASSRYLLGLGC